MLLLFHCWLFEEYKWKPFSKVRQKCSLTIVSDLLANKNDLLANKNDLLANKNDLLANKSPMRDFDLLANNNNLLANKTFQENKLNRAMGDASF